MPEPLVSVVVIFFNEERFLGETIDSVLCQSHSNWELLLADDGSTDASAEIARGYATRFPDRIRYVQHPGGENRGASATRNLGIRHASGKYCAFLDGDDVWLPEKLERQVKILEARADVDMVYGQTEYWHDWQPGARWENRVQPHHIGGEVEMPAPRLLPLLLSGDASVPCTCSVLVRSSVLEAVGGFEESFPALYDDQAFYAKICLEHVVFVSDQCLERYRQHSASMTATLVGPATVMAARRDYLDWLAEYARSRDVLDCELWRVLTRERWLLSETSLSPRLANARRRLRRLRSKMEVALLPAGVLRGLWAGRATRLGGAFAAPASGGQSEVPTLRRQR